MSQQLIEVRLEPVGVVKCLRTRYEYEQNPEAGMWFIPENPVFSQEGFDEEMNLCLFTGKEWVR